MNRGRFTIISVYLNCGYCTRLSLYGGPQMGRPIKPTSAMSRSRSVSWLNVKGGIGLYKLTWSSKIGVYLFRPLARVIRLAIKLGHMERKC